MLLAVEGGGFFSSSASGYSNGLALLILGRRNEDKHIKVSPWNQYHLVEQEVGPDSTRHSRKSRASRGFSYFMCFGCVPAGQDGSSASEAAVDQLSGTSSGSLSSSDGDNLISSDATKKSEKRACLKSNLKKSSTESSQLCQIDDACELLDEADNGTSCCTVTRKVQWTDKCGKELVEIREFEVSDEVSSEEEYKGEGFRRCECVIQ